MKNIHVLFCILAEFIGIFSSWLPVEFEETKNESGGLYFLGPESTASIWLNLSVSPFSLGNETNTKCKIQTLLSGHCLLVNWVLVLLDVDMVCS